MDISFDQQATQTGIKVSSMDYGKVFRRGNDICIKIKPVNFLLNSSIICDSINRGKCLITNLKTGNTFIIEGWQEVEPLDAKLVIYK